MLLNEFLKEHRKVQELEASLARQQKDFAQQQNEIEALAASLKEQALEGRVLSRKSPSRSPPARGVFVGALWSAKIAFSRWPSEGLTVMDIPLRMRQTRTSAALWESLKGFNC
jgi:hypothetical protein